MTSSIEYVRGSPSGIELSMTSPWGVHPVKVIVTRSWGPGCAPPWAFDSSFQARPLAVLVDCAGASATSGGGGGAAGRAFPSGSMGWADASGPVERVPRRVATDNKCSECERTPAAYHTRASTAVRASRPQVRVSRTYDGTWVSASDSGLS